MAVTNDSTLARACRAAVAILTPEAIAAAPPACRGLLWLVSRRLDQRLATSRRVPSTRSGLAIMAGRLAEIDLDHDVDMLGALSRAFRRKAVFFNFMLEHAASDPRTLPLVAAWATRQFLAEPGASFLFEEEPPTPDWLRLAGQAFMKGASDLAATRLLQPDWTHPVVACSGLSPQDIGACWIMGLALGWPAIGMHYDDDMLPSAPAHTRLWPYRRLARWMTAGGCDLPAFDHAHINHAALEHAVGSIPQTLLTPFALRRSLHAAMETAMMGAHRHWLARPSQTRPRLRA